MGNGVTRADTAILYTGESEARYLQVEKMLVGANGRDIRVSFARGDAAVEGSLNAAPFDIVLVDDSPGYPAYINRIAGFHSAFPAVPILFMTDDEDEVVTCEARNAGAMVCLPASDLTPAFLQWVIRHAIEQSRAEAGRRSAANRDAFRVRLADTLRPLTDPAEMKRAASRMLAESLGANRAAFVEIDPANQTFLVEEDYYAVGLGTLAGRRQYRNPAAHILEMIRSGQALVVNDTAEITSFSEREQGIYAAVRCRSFVLAPLISDGRMVACMAAGLEGPHAWSANEIALAQETAERTWAAVARAQAETALRASEAKYRTLYESIDEGFLLTKVIFDENDRPVDLVYLETNPAIRRLAGVDYTGKRLLEINPNPESYWLEIWGRVARTGRGERLERFAAQTQKWYSFYVFWAGEPGQNLVASVLTDVTERKMDEAALRESEERMRALVEPFAQAVWETDAAGMVVKDSPSWRAYTGQSLEEWLGEGWVNAVHPEDRAYALRQWQESAASGRPVNAEFRLRSPSGGYRWTNLRAVPLRRPGGEIRKWVGMNIDITERRQAEEALQQSIADLAAERNRLLVMLETLPVGVAILDENGGIASKNKGYDELWGNPIPETTSVDDYSAFKAWWVENGEPVQPEEWASAVAVRTGRTVQNQYLIIERFDGKRIHVLNSAAPIMGADGTVKGCVVAIRDVTRMAEIEAELRESQKRFRIALQAVPIMVYTCDREQRYTSIYQPLRGFSAEDVIGRRDDELIPPEAAAELVAVKQKALDSGLGGMQEVRVPLNGEDTFYILTTEPMRDIQGNITGLTCSAIDITTQKRLEAEQRESAIQIEVQRRLMDQRERERSSFARDIHDGPIQTLSAALFMLQTLRADFPDSTDQQEIAQLSEDIKKSIQELRDLMNDLRPPALLHFGLSQVIRYMTDDFRARYPSIKFELDLGDDERDTLPEPVRLSLFRVYQAAISNVIRHSGATRVWVRFSIEADTYQLELRDNGTGFAVNGDFDRLSNEGHFGLIGMKERADAIGARLEISSQPQGGTVIRVTGPVTP